MLRNDLYRPWFKNEDWGFEIISGDFKDTVLKIDKMEFAESEEGNCQLEYTTVSKPESITDEDLKSQLFDSTINLIITDLLTEAIKIYENDQQTRDNDTPQSNQQ